MNKISDQADNGQCATAKSGGVDTTRAMSNKVNGEELNK